jgi:hypothetical protein
VALAARTLAAVVRDALELIPAAVRGPIEPEAHPGSVIRRLWPRAGEFSATERAVFFTAVAMWNGDPTATVAMLRWLDRRTGLALWSLVAEWMTVGENDREEQT